MEYFTITTNAGDQAIAQAIQTGTTKTLKSIAVGDGNGTYYDPAKSQTALRREVWRGDAVVALDPNNTKRVIVMATIPATVGGFTIREAGIIDTSGTLMVVSKLPLSEKVSPDSGASTDLVIRLYVEVSDVSAVSITIDPSAILATKGDISNALVPISADLQEQKNAAVRSATIDGAAVTKNGTELQLPAYPVIPDSLPANGGMADYASNSVALIAPGLRNAVILPSTTEVPTGFADGTVVLRYTV